MLRSETKKFHCVKCLISSIMKGKDVILGPKANTLENHARKKRLFKTCCTWGKNKENGMSIRSATMQKMKWLTLRKIASQLLKKFKEGLKGSGVESGNNLLQSYTCYIKPSPCLNLRL